jgi:hypothetical protein
MNCSRANSDQYRLARWLGTRCCERSVLVILLARFWTEMFSLLRLLCPAQTLPESRHREIRKTSWTPPLRRPTTLSRVRPLPCRGLPHKRQGVFRSELRDAWSLVLGCKWHRCLVEHPCHFGRGLLKTKDNAGGWLSNLRPTVCVQSGKIEVRRLVHQSAIFSS